MGEFVEHSLESLLPTFEQLSHVQLFTEGEVNAFIKRCRQFEYRLNKHEKSARDFNLYAEYLCDFLTLLKSRRAKMQYWHKKKLIDGPLRKKVASIYRRAADRFQGDLRLWEQLINFLNENAMRRELAVAYTRALQIHGKNEKLRRDFALWQFFSAASPQNARTQLLGSLRLFPQSPMLFAALFTVEIHFVDKVLKRRKFITEEKDKRRGDNENDAERVYDEEVDDTIMNLDVAKAVVEQALSSVPAEAASGMLVEMWKECNKVELVGNIDKVRSFIVDELNKVDNEDTRLFEIELAESSGTKQPQSSLMWNVYLEKSAASPATSPEQFRELCNRALEKVDLSENFPIWQRAIEYSILHAPEETEQIFKDALKYTITDVCSRVKILFVDYLNELFNAGKISADVLRERILDLVNSKPNRAEFYCSLYRKEMERPMPDHKFAGLVIRTAVNEEDAASVEAVILYGKWALEHDPAKFHVVHQSEGIGVEIRLAIASILGRETCLATWR
ncbi:unnamed protein product [Heligmosomoides polygyrus]|uniref:U3 small nucleolar RNA-associated protein 6 homolog n=1 Tax=Heligmosomoides polygyrus TaxID=6339 RepID=A0A183GKB3_HELPZ|nr:unnamed protein product [Heligmosomoides polygyrus]